MYRKQFDGDLATEAHEQDNHKRNKKFLVFDTYDGDRRSKINNKRTYISFCNLESTVYYLIMTCCCRYLEWV